MYVTSATVIDSRFCSGCASHIFDKEKTLPFLANNSGVKLFVIPINSIIHLNWEGALGC